MRAFLILTFSIIGIFLFLPNGVYASITFITPVEVTPGSTSSWIDVDNVSVPDGAEGVVLHVVHNLGSATHWNFGARMNGSTDNRHLDIVDDQHFWTSVGVDASGIFEIWVENNSDVDVFLVGYYNAGDSNFFQNAIDKSLGSTGTWLDIDISGDTTGGDVAIGAMFEIRSTGEFNRVYGLRMNGSTDERVDGDLNLIGGAIIGVDGSEILEMQVSNLSTDLYLQGYILTNSTFLINGTDISLGTTGSYTDLTALPATGIGGYIESFGTELKYALRKNGTAEDIYQDQEGKPFAIVEADGDRIIEGKIENTSVDFFLIGYATGVAPPAAAAATSTSQVIDWF